ncbi:hypothetical protein [Campylobacter sp. JMF_03 NE3]|uniref:hypothetical protein n=1 Tax=Campylobacter sp. JMF_03 NE3 TaxID=2983831 RepID=UPI0022E9FD6F|nr:hypothetical protein [Campylobacter sp. JMF_03 NE3]MDA3053519.1 hypothetical protein [Campylobacter sp. JMF_03 NE3]
MKNKILVGLLASITALNALSLKEIETNIDELKLANSKEFKTNFDLLIKNIPNDVSIKNITKLQNSTSLIAIIEDKSGATLPVFISGDGTILNSIPEVFVANEQLSLEIQEYLKKYVSIDNEVSAEKKMLDQKVKSVTDSLPKEYAVRLESNKKDSKFNAIIISDPECPYCRAHLQNELPQMLEEMSVTIYFAPVHEVPSYIKSQLILNETNKAKTTQEKLEILKKYYSENYVLLDKDKKIDYNKVETYRNIIFNETGVTGVPFVAIYER